MLLATERLSELFRAYADWLQSFDDRDLLLVLRVVLVLGLPTLLARTIFEIYHNRSMNAQVLSVLCGLLVAFGLPLRASWFVNGTVRLWVLTFALVSLLMLPRTFAFYLVPTRMSQRVVVWGLYAFLFLLFFIL